MLSFYQNPKISLEDLEAAFTTATAIPAMCGSPGSPGPPFYFIRAFECVLDSEA
jgi:hypothetical protein